MAKTTEWFLKKDTNTVGPFSSHQLRELALSGKLQTDDLVRKGVDGGFVAANRVKSLFAPDQAESRPTTPPPRLPSMAVNDEQSTPETAESVANSPPATSSPTWSNRLIPYFTTARHKLSDFGEQAKHAGELGKLIARRTQLQQYQLPQAFAALGAFVHSQRRYVDEFPNQINAIDEAISQQAELIEKATPENQSENLMGKAKDLTDGLLRRGKGVGIGLKASKLQRDLGEAVYREHGADSGPEELVVAVENSEAEMRELQQKIDDLEAAGRGRVLTPRRLLLGGVATVFLVGCAGLLSTLSGNNSSRTEEFFQNLPANIESSEFQGREIAVTGIWSKRGAARGIDGERIEGKIELGLSTEYKDVSALCRFDQADEKIVEELTKNHSQVTVSGTLLGRHPFPDKNVYLIILDNCSIVDKQKKGEETIAAFSRRLPLPKADTFIAQLEQMGGTQKKRYPDQRTSSFLTKSNLGIEDGVPRIYYEIHAACSYRDWVDVFGEPSQIRTPPHQDRGMAHAWVHSYNGQTVHVLGALKTGHHYAPMIKSNQLAPNSYPPSSWNVIVHAVCVE